MTQSPREVDLAVVGGGAAGLAAAIFAREAARSLPGAGPSVAILEGARLPGAKILVSGGGRCNVANERALPEDYFGGPRPVVRNVLRSFDSDATVSWMRSLGVPLKLEPSGKYFPTSDRARTVLDALLGAARSCGADLRLGARVADFRPEAGAFRLDLLDGDSIRARRVVLATGGLALPKSGSDGAGLAIARRLGHGIVPTTPALVPLVVEPDGSVGAGVRDLAGVSFDAVLSLRERRGDGSAPGKPLHETRGSLLFAHFGLTGPAALDFSRHFSRFRVENPDAPAPVVQLRPAFLSGPPEADAWLLDLAKRHPARECAAALAERLPERFAALLAADAGRLAELTRDRRRVLAERLGALPVPVSGDRGYTFAEVTAGGISLREIDAATMASRVVPGLHLCGEILDADGRVGGFNFQWAWATGRLAGIAALRALAG